MCASVFPRGWEWGGCDSRKGRQLLSIPVSLTYSWLAALTAPPTHTRTLFNFRFGLFSQSQSGSFHGPPTDTENLGQMRPQTLKSLTPNQLDRQNTNKNNPWLNFINLFKPKPQTFEDLNGVSQLAYVNSYQLREQGLYQTLALSVLANCASWLIVRAWLVAASVPHLNPGAWYTWSSERENPFTSD